MIKIIVIILLLVKVPLIIVAQHGETLELQIETDDLSAEIQIFYEKFDLWLESTEGDSTKLELNESLMINNFIIFTEIGLIMKDLDFHTAESCKARILNSLPMIETNNKSWIYVSLESQVNKADLVEILKFLKDQNIDYIFENEDLFVAKLMNK